MTKHVLLVEDEPNIIEAISFILTREGWKVDTHSNGHDAVEVIQDRSPDLLVLDVMLPGKSGYDILREVRAHSEMRELPVLMLTARGQKKDQETALEAGANRFMSKPFSNSEVLQTLKEMAGE